MDDIDKKLLLVFDNDKFLNFPSTSSQANQSRVSDDAWTNDSSSSRNFLPTFGPNPPPTPITAKKKIFLRKVELTINGTPVDMIEDKQTEDECIQGIFFYIYKILTKDIYVIFNATFMRIL